MQTLPVVVLDIDYQLHGVQFVASISVSQFYGVTA